jgi:hypothetical protein
MIVLALTLALAVLVVHANDPAARGWALALVALAVGAAFFVILAHDRPFVGYLALTPAPILAAAQAP